MNWYLVSCRPNKRDLFLKQLDFEIEKNQLGNLFLEQISPRDAIYKNNERFGWRLFCETEKLAIFHFWQKVGEKMNLKNIPSTYEKFAQYNHDYEQENFVYSDSNRRLGESTINLFLSWFPYFSPQMLRPCVYGIFDDLTLTAFGWSKPTPFVCNLVENSLKWRGHLSRWLLPRRQPDFYTDSKLRSYPDGYKLSDLGPQKMLKELNRNN